jgi:hypothetical protein
MNFDFTENDGIAKWPEDNLNVKCKNISAFCIEPLTHIMYVRGDTCGKIQTKQKIVDGFSNSCGGFIDCSGIF